MKLNLGAIAMHAILAGVVTMTAAAFGGFWPGVGAAALLTIGYPAREVWQAARRHAVGYGAAAVIVIEGEDGWSPWNLRLQALSPAAMAWAVVAYSGSVGL